LSAATRSPAFEGHLRVEAARRPDGRTTLVRQSHRAPFHLGKPYWDGRVLQMRVVNATAGILAGDQLELSAQVGAGAALLVITPAATRAFVMRRGAAECRQHFAVAAGGWLECAPEPLFPHRDSDYAQATRLDVAAGGGAYFVEALAPGRTGRGETWAWRRLRLTLDVSLGGTLALRERFDGAGADLGGLAAMYGMAEAWFGTVVAVFPQPAEDGGIAARVNALQQPGRWVGATRLRPGAWVVRVVAPGALALRGTLAALRGLFSPALPLHRSNLPQV
jgi:urease accessory protein